MHRNVTVLSLRRYLTAPTLLRSKPRERATAIVTRMKLRYIRRYGSLRVLPSQPRLLLPADSPTKAQTRQHSIFSIFPLHDQSGHSVESVLTYPNCPASFLRLL